ncbi:histidine triad nucleotide-binding protein 3 [Elysia marginata]|uniref:Adenosine 5'-monophosphoramidase HINT3 n=1 Tax=Elysia marginata TaxID=1093978 RepID=A0AAV4IRI1_9GAST|nr:histidine triad nucleotide-binding protein 3 [Elysia marginata]
MAEIQSNMDNENRTQINMNCLFCRIANSLEPGSQVLYEKDGIAIFKDIRPVATHHYLVVPQRHVDNPKALGSEDVELVEQLIASGQEFLGQQGGNVLEARLGFHWPPFHTISHLHLHVICPMSDLGWVASLIFRPDSFWFVSAAWLLQRLRNMKLVR